MKKVKLDEMSNGQSLKETSLEEPLEILLHQGAEAKVYKVVHTALPPQVLQALASTTAVKDSTVLVRKERLLKSWRHPILDARLNKTRLKQEFNCLLKAKNAGIPVPTPIYMDMPSHFLFMEFIDGITLKNGLNIWTKEESILFNSNFFTNFLNSFVRIP